MATVEEDRPPNLGALFCGEFVKAGVIYVKGSVCVQNVGHMIAAIAKNAPCDRGAPGPAALLPPLGMDGPAALRQIGGRY